VEPFKIVKEGERFKLTERGWSYTAREDLELIKIGTPTHGLLVWLPDKRSRLGEARG
jgi:hypothetical protein